MSDDRTCLRGCTTRGVHYASCERTGPAWEGVPGECRGCAPRECRDGCLVCDQCFGRIRGLLDDAPDLAARLRSIGDPSKATAYDNPRTGSTQGGAPSAPIGDDLLDALHVVYRALAWRGADMRAELNNSSTVRYLSALLLDRHPPMVDGTREAWSLQDAVDRWGVERRTKTEPWSEDPEREEVVTPVPEHGSPLIPKHEAARLAGSEATLRRWEREGHVSPAGRMQFGAARATPFYRRTEIIATKRAMEARGTAGLKQNQTDRSE